MGRRHLLLAVAAIAWTGCSGASPGGAGTTGTTGGSGGNSGAADLPPPADGAFDLLVYNVAGLPQGVSGSNPAVNMVQISPLLNKYDLALVQEDFAYHEELLSEDMHPYVSEPKPSAGGLDMGDGLNRFSWTPFSDHTRTAWAECSGQFSMGSDCLTSKGFAVATHELAPGVFLDIYNLHMDASSNPEDVAARMAQVDQLLAAIDARSEGRAIVVAGDTNMDEDPEDEQTLQTLLQGAGLTDVCRALDCGDAGRIDRAMFRSSDTLTLTPVSWALDGDFVDDQGELLSDHEAVAVTLSWSFAP